MHIIQEITVINNRNNREHIFKTENEFGLDWDQNPDTKVLKNKTKF